MTDEIALQRSADRAAKAQRLLEDEIYREAWDKLEAGYIAAWRDSDPRDTQGRELAWMALQVLGKVRGHMKTVIENGKIAQRELGDLARRREAAQRRGKTLGVG